MELLYVTLPTLNPEPENEFQSFIGSKIIRAKRMTHDNFIRTVKNTEPDPNAEDQQGWLVEYPDNYLSWSPDSVFQEAYRLISSKEKLLI